MTSFSPSLLERTVQRIKIPWSWFVILVAVVLLLLPWFVAYVEGIMDEFLRGGVWRNLLQAPAIILYILVLIRPMNRSLERAVETLRPVIEIDDDSFEVLVSENTDIDDRAEIWSFAIGAVIGILSTFAWDIEPGFVVLRTYLYLINAVMFGALAWIIYTSLTSTKLQRELHRLPMQIDLFNLKPFEAIGRHALFVALAFVGGSVISMLFINPVRQDVDPFSLAVYVILGTVTVLIFFLSMQPTHRLLAEKKRTELVEVRSKIWRSFQGLQVLSPERENIVAISSELNLWLKYEELLEAARTWPYNTAMLRTLVVSVLLPAAVSIGQRVLASLFSN
jgi:hypothetical protein